MAKNITFKPGQHLPAPVPANTKAGTAVRIGGLNAVTITDRAKTDVTPLNADGTINTAYNAGGGNANGNASVHFEGVALGTPQRGPRRRCVRRPRRGGRYG